MSNKQKILYIEDDVLDIQNMKWLCNNADDISLNIITDFEELPEAIKTINPNLIITDQYLRTNHFSKYIHAFNNIDYIVLSNNLEINTTLQKNPKHILKKPLLIKTFRELILNEKQAEDHPKIDFFNTISDENTKTKMIQLLKSELSYAQEKLPQHLENRQIEEMITIIHKISGKFSILNMKESYDLSRELELNLKNNTLETIKIQKLITNINNALHFLTTKFNLHESHNS